MQLIESPVSGPESGGPGWRVYPPRNGAGVGQAKNDWAGASVDLDHFHVAWPQV